MNASDKIEHFQLLGGNGQKLEVGVHILDHSHYNSSLHDHDFFDFDFLQTGTLIQIANGKRLKMYKNELCIVRPETIHQTLPDNKGFFFYNFVASYDFLKKAFYDIYNVDVDEVLNKPIIKIPLNSNETQEITQLLSLAQANISNNTKYIFYIKLIIFNFIKIIVLKTNTTLLNQKNTPYIIQEFLIELNKPENFSLSITNICKNLSYTHEHIIRLFNKQGLESPNKIFLKNKLRYATMILRSSDIKIAEIPEKCGIFTMSYFNKAFKAEYNLSPSEYRKKYRTTSIIN